MPVKDTINSVGLVRLANPSNLISVGDLFPQAQPPSSPLCNSVCVQKGHCGHVTSLTLPCSKTWCITQLQIFPKQLQSASASLGAFSSDKTEYPIISMSKRMYLVNKAAVAAVLVCYRKVQIDHCDSTYRKFHLGLLNLISNPYIWGISGFNSGTIFIPMLFQRLHQALAGVGLKCCQKF